MKKTDLIDKIAEKTNITKKEVEVVCEALKDTIIEALVSGDKVLISGFGSFEVRERAARTGLNPRTGEAIQIPALKTPAFTAGKVLKDAVR
ncbi:MAG: HU family DNA-binding protein [Anaeroplasmataceae bacterium]